VTYSCMAKDLESPVDHLRLTGGKAREKRERNRWVRCKGGKRKIISGITAD